MWSGGNSLPLLGPLIIKNIGETRDKVTQTFSISIVIGVLVFLRVIPLAVELSLL